MYVRENLYVYVCMYMCKCTRYMNLYEFVYVCVFKGKSRVVKFGENISRVLNHCYITVESSILLHGFYSVLVQNRNTTIVSDCTLSKELLIDEAISPSPSSHPSPSPKAPSALIPS